MVVGPAFALAAAIGLAIPLVGAGNRRNYVFVALLVALDLVFPSRRARRDRDPSPIKEIRVDTTHKIIEIAPGVRFSAWTFGDKIRFTMTTGPTSRRGESS